MADDAMMWHDVLLDLVPDPAPRTRIASALAAAFDLAPSEIAVVEDAALLPAHAAVVVVVSTLRGEYPCLLSIYVNDAARASLEVAGTVHRLCAALQCTALVSDARVDPFTMLQVDAAGRQRPVSLDPVAMDERGEYRVVRPRD